MSNKPIRIPLDEFILEIDPAIESRKGSFLLPIKTKVYLPSGDVIDSGFRYDIGKRIIIDPVLQDDDLKKHGLIDEDKYLNFDGDFKSEDPNYQRWIDHRKKVNQKINESLENGDLKLDYGDGQLRTLKEDRIYQLKKEIKELESS